VARRALSAKKWNRRVLKTIDIIESLLHYDTLYIGGGNADDLTAKLLPDNVRIASNDAGITGGIHLWDEAVWQVVRSSNRHSTRRARRTAVPRASAFLHDTAAQS
jgi:polyphosphate glucokinase